MGSISLLMALLLVNTLLLASQLGPQWFVQGTLGSTWLALEAPLIVGVFALLPRQRWSTVTAVATACTLMLLTTVVFADALFRQSFGRPLNIYLDVHLLSSVANLLTGTLGPLGAVLVAVVTVIAAVLVTGSLALLLCRLGVRSKQLKGRAAGLMLLACFVVLTGLRTTSTELPVLARRTALPAVTVATDQARHLSRMLDERRVFLAELENHTASYADLPGLLQGLRGGDVILGFIESYGISALDDPRYAPILRPRLDELARRMATASLHLTTGSLVAPTQGGLSWLSHGSLLSGIWIDNQLRYDLLLASGRETLIDDFSRAGYRTVALMPAITLAWPEGERLGYDRILAHKNIDYSGPPLNWVTMPDQFTWSFLQNRVRDKTASDPRPLFAELSLISSHAPWTPILPVLDDWDSIGDGSIFAAWENAGEPPHDLWRDTERIREHFALSVDYAVAAMTAYAERFIDEKTLLVVLGDHQPAPLITGDDASQVVPVHVISGDSELVQRFTDWGFEPGAFPHPTRSPRRMDAFRDWFVRAFSGQEIEVNTCVSHLQ